MGVRKGRLVRRVRGGASFVETRNLQVTNTDVKWRDESIRSESTKESRTESTIDQILLLLAVSSACK